MRNWIKSLMLLLTFMVAMVVTIKSFSGGQNKAYAAFGPAQIVDYPHGQNRLSVFRFADSLKYHQDYAAAAAAFETALSEHQLAQSDVWYAGNQLIMIQLQLGRDSLAREIFQQIQDTSGLLLSSASADYCYNKGVLAYRIGDWKTALYQLKRASAQYADLYGTNHFRYAQSLNQVGLVLISQSDNPEAAKEYIQEASIVFNNNPDLEPYRCENYLAMAHIALLDRDYKRGRNLCDLALERFNQANYGNNLLKAKIVCAKGTHLKRLKLVSEANQLFQDGVALIRRHGYSYEAGDLLKTASFQLVEWRDQRPLFPEGFDDFFKKSTSQQGYPDWVRGFVWYYKSNPDSVVHYMEQFLQKNQQTDAKTLDGACYILAECYATKGNYKKSLDFAYQDLAIGTDSSHLNFVVFGLIGRILFEKYKKTGRLEDLIQAERNFSIVDSLFFPSLLAFSEEAILGFQQQVGDDCFPQALEATFMLYKKTQHKKWLDKAIRYSERMKSLLLYRDMLTNQAKTNASYFTWADSSRHVSARINRLQFLQANQRNWTTASQQQMETAIATLEAVNLNRRRSSEEYNATIRQPIPGIAAIQSALGEAEVMIEYCFGKESLYSICLAHNGVVRIAQVTDVSGIKRRLKWFHAALSDYRSQLIPMTDSLSRDLLAPFNAVLSGKKKLLIVPDRELYLLPFEVLFWSSKDGLSGKAPPDRKMVIHDFAVAYTPSWKVHSAHLQTLSQPFSLTRIGIWSDGSLPFSSITTRAIFEAFAPKAPVDTFCGASCTKAQFMRSQQQYDVLHLFMHGHSNLSDRHDNKLSFGQPLDTLWGFEVQEQAFKARLIVLAACETGLGTNETGEGAFTLSRSFLQAGITQVVATLWEIQQEKTSIILADFYTRLGAGVPPVYALQEAKKGYQQQAQGIWQHPAFWAGAVLME